MAMQPLKVYADRLSQPSRAVIIFCRANQIDFQEVTVDLLKTHHRIIEFNKINPMGQVPAILDGRFRLFERYPADLFNKAKAEFILDWHHSNLRRGAGDAKFLHGNPKPSIADLSLVCEIMQLEVVGDERCDRILGPHEKVRSWMENVNNATSPHFDEAHELLFKVKARLSSAAHVKTASKL